MTGRAKLAARIGVYGTIMLVALAWFATPNYLGDPVSPEAGAIALLRGYLGAQWKFRKQDRYGRRVLVYANTVCGTGFPDLFRLGGPMPEGEAADGADLKLIDLAFARATSPAKARYGYWFVDIVGDAVSGKHYDYTKECGLCAVPAVYGKTGINTYVIDLCGTVYAKDTHGTPVRVFPDVANEGWKRLDW